MSETEPRGRQRRGQATPEDAAAPAYVTHVLSWCAMADEEALDRIENRTFALIERIGIEFRDDPAALDRWCVAGADVTETRVRAAPELICGLLSSAPEEFTQVARNPARSVRTSGRHQVFAPVYGSLFARDLEGGRRYGTLGDFQRLVTLIHALHPPHHSGFVICEPCDIPVSKRHLDMLLAQMTLTDKLHLGVITKKSRAGESVAMARILHGDAVFDSSCVIMANVNSNSPLLVDKVATEAMMVGAYVQLVRPRAPCILGNFLSSMNLRSGAPTFGMPGPMMSNFVIGQQARWLKLPLRCGGALTASKLPDFQAAAESAGSMLSTVLVGANFVLHAAGWLEGGLSTGYEKLVLDADRLGTYEAALRGFSLDDNAMWLDADADAEPGEHFLGSAHTLANYTNAFYEAKLSNSDSVEQWEGQGAKDAARRSSDRWNLLLKHYVAPPMDAGIAEALNDYVARRKSELPDARN